MLQTLVKRRVYLIAALQCLIIVLSYAAAHLLRFDFRIPEPYLTTFWQSLLPVLVLKVAIFYWFGLFSGWWRYVSMADLLGIVKANAMASLVITATFVFYNRFEGIPRSVIALDGIICFLAIGGIRFATRAWRENYLPLVRRSAAGARRLLVVGAGDAGLAIVRELRVNRKLGLEPVGYVDDDSKKIGSSLLGLKVLGSTGEIARICDQYAVDEAVIAIPSASGRKIREIVDACASCGVRNKILPGYGELIDGKVSFDRIREVDLEDLLGRNPIVLDEAQISSYLKGKRVLVTGAGGSIGSEICRQILRFDPEKLVLFENAETPLFHIEQELSGRRSDVPITSILGDIRNPSRVRVIFDEQMPQVVFHAAAYKHVPMMEANPAEAINNNVRGTQILANTADEVGVETFVMVSTDKAVRPTNVMGASKRTAELYVQALAKTSRTRFVTTRFGNVLGSNGSVIPTFKQQIKNGGPVTVTHPEVTRFFMTIPEASQLVLQAGSMGKGGEIYLFDMGEAVKIQSLAEELIRLSGLQPHEDIEIIYTGLRPGEKLYEELLLADEGVLPTRHEKICIARSAPPPMAQLLGQLERLTNAAKNLDIDGIRRGLEEIVPEYRPAAMLERGKVAPLPAREARPS